MKRCHHFRYLIAGGMLLAGSLVTASQAIAQPIDNRGGVPAQIQGLQSSVNGLQATANGILGGIGQLTAADQSNTRWTPPLAVDLENFRTTTFTISVMNVGSVAHTFKIEFVDEFGNATVFSQSVVVPAQNFVNGAFGPSTTHRQALRVTALDGSRTDIRASIQQVFTDLDGVITVGAVLAAE